MCSGFWIKNSGCNGECGQGKREKLFYDPNVNSTCEIKNGTKRFEECKVTNNINLFFSTEHVCLHSKKFSFFVYLFISVKFIPIISSKIDHIF